MFEKIYYVNADGMQKKVSANDLQIMVNNDQITDLNLIYRSNTKTAFAAFRLCSWVSTNSETGENERVTKFLVEVGTYDANRPKGSRQKYYVQIYLDEYDFAYFCGLMKDGRIIDVMEREARRGNKIPYKHHNGVTEAKRLRIYQGSRMPIILEAAKGPGKKGDKGQTIPDDWEGRNKEKVVKAMIGLTEEEASKIGSAGMRALQILDMWRAFGRDEENLHLINIKKKNDSGRENTYQNSGYSGNNPCYNGGYAASGSRNTGYGNNRSGYVYGQRAM